jgi:hypothetical protein
VDSHPLSAKIFHLKMRGREKIAAAAIKAAPVKFQPLIRACETTYYDSNAIFAQ